MAHLVYGAEAVGVEEGEGVEVIYLVLSAHSVRINYASLILEG